MRREKERIVILAESFPSKSRPNYNGGIEVALYDLAKKLLENGNIVKIIAAKNSKDDTETFGDIEIIRVDQLAKAIHANISRVFEILIYQLKLYKVIKNQKANTIIAGNHTLYPIAQIIKFFNHKMNIKLYVADILGYDWIKYFHFAGIFGYIVEKLTLLNKWAQFITISESSRQKLIKSGIPEKMIKIIRPKNQALTVKGYDKKSKIPRQILMVGRLVNYKNVDIGIKIFSDLKVKTTKQLSLIIIGDGPERDNLRKLINNLSQSQSIKILSNVSNAELEKYYQSSSVFLHLSKIEGYGLAVREALSYGCTTIVLKLPVFEELENPTNQDFFAGNNESEIHNLLVKVLNAKS
ncbi:hypothetical protein COV25_00085 [candidate division WWE3 bacterium CG10_big_fil_rev_8_21_14_0_10_35_32]|nr:MAG: hypothetical protein COV25_00085 [candidate division WWE3 bacterium CG10_big_fil_rev_8_21_14_0_10_35_32]